mgnify:CR=1 FL=1
MHCRSRGNTDKHALVFTYFSAADKCVFIFNGNNFIVNRGIKHIRHKACTYTLYFMRTRGLTRKHRRACRLNRNYLYIRIFGLKILTYARNRAARSDTGYKYINLTVGIGIYFGTCGLKMRLGVGRVYKLPRNKAARNFFA